jgi:hypothetical protein
MTCRSEHPILFSGPMVRAILDGRKSMTRRVVVPPRKCQIGGRHMFYPGERWWVGPCPTGGFWAVDDPAGPPSRWTPSGPGFRCPYGVPGDLLWVREAFCAGRSATPSGFGIIPRVGKPEPGDKIVYRASWTGDDQPPWRPSVHMPR